MKSRQIARTSGGTNSSRPVNSLVKKVWLSFGCDDIALRSSIGAQATPTEKMVMPGDWVMGDDGIFQKKKIEHKLGIFCTLPCFCASSAGILTSSYDWPSVTTMRKLRPGPVRLNEDSDTFSSGV